MLELVIAAICVVESGNSPYAIGDAGKAHGIVQIRQEVIDDVNRYYGTAFKLADAYQPETAKKICVKYLLMWCGHYSTPEEYARTWNGGPRWKLKPLAVKRRTLAYWKKVQKIMGEI